MKKICVVTGTRADYGLLYWTMKSLQEDSAFQLQIIATCMHLDPRFGNTCENIIADGFKIDKKIPLGELLDSRESVVKQISIGLTAFFGAYNELKPDLIIILGDRYEMLAAAQAAVFANIPIAHIHGGEVTEGAFDDVIRHSITKMSSYHFTSTETYRKRVIQMGEVPERVINVGAVGLENINRLNLLTKEEIEKNLNFKIRENNFLITYHPVTQNFEDDTELLISALSEYSSFGQIITMPNSDPGHSKVMEALTAYANGRENVFLASNLGSLKYLSLMKIVKAVIGNSSSGIIEAPFFGVPTLNIGTRQKGRLHDDSVIHTEGANIKENLSHLLQKSFAKSSLYGNGNSSSLIIDFLKRNKLKNKSGFYDI